MRKIIICVIFISILQIKNSVLAQSGAINRLSLGVGLTDITLLDRQSSPLLYKGSGPAFALAFERKKPTSQWQWNLIGGLLFMQPKSDELQFEDPYLSATCAGFNVTYLKLIGQSKKSNWWIGASLNEEVLVDLNYEIGRWAYALGQGGLYAKAKWDYHISQRHHFGTSLSIPLLAVITDMPYHQIPRVEGEAPDVASLFKVGTRIPFWDTYQRVDIDLSYEFSASDKWVFSTQYDWSWVHDSEPKDLWAYSGIFYIKVIRNL